MLKNFNDFRGGLDLTQSTQIADNSFTIAKNVYYNNAKQIETRRGYTTFGPELGGTINSIFSYQRDDNLKTILIACAGTSIYKYDETTNTRSSIATDLAEFENTKPTDRVRWDFCVYKNIIYMCNGVDQNCKYDGTTFTRLGTGAVHTGITVNTTDNTIVHAGHGLVVGDEVLMETTVLPMPGGLTFKKVYYVASVPTSGTFTLSNTFGGPIVDITSTGSGSGLQYVVIEQPRIRYISYLQDRLYGGGEDKNPNTLYYTNTLPTNGDTIDTNLLVVGGDEAGRINAIKEYGQSVLVFKNYKTYDVNVVTTSSQAIDIQSGAYSNRCIKNVNNDLLYFNERGIDALRTKQYISGIESKPLSDKIADLIDTIDQSEYNANCSHYIKQSNNYYFNCDTDKDNIPNTTLVYNTGMNVRTQYNYPNIYDYCDYITSTPETYRLFASGTQIYRFEYGYTDNNNEIESEIETKKFDFNDPAQVKAFRSVDVTGRKQKGKPITIQVKVDSDTVAVAEVTDATIDYSSGAIVLTPLLGEGVIGEYSIGGGSSSISTLQLYKYTVNVPFFALGTSISVNIKSSGVQRQLEKMRIDVDGQNKDVFFYNNII